MNLKFKPVDLLTVYLEFKSNHKIKVGRLAKSRATHQIFFEYDSGFLKTNLEISPFKLPLATGVFNGDPEIFNGLMGVFEDSLPDGWGRLLLDRRMAQAGITAASLGPLDRLAWVGSSGMGALVYEPEFVLEQPTVVNLSEIASNTKAVLDGAPTVNLARLIALGGSPQGARPKVLVQISFDGRKILSGSRNIRSGFTPFLIKFRAKGDERCSAQIELAYNLMARAAGIDVSEAKILGGTKSHSGYFAIKRFDRVGQTKIHMHTLSGLLHAPHTYPSLTYRDLLLATRKLTRDERAVAEMFRRACFNVFAHNRDDHPKNFAFLMATSGEWTVSPAYDLTYSDGPGGEHMLAVGKEGKNPTRIDLEVLAREAGLKKYKEIIEQVSSTVVKFCSFADEAIVPKKSRDYIAKALVKIIKQ